MWVLIALNVVVLVGLLATVWRLRHVHASLIRRRQVPIRGAIQPLGRRPGPLMARPHTALDEFPSESDEAAMAVFREPRPRPVGARAHRLVPLGR